MRLTGALGRSPAGTRGFTLLEVLITLLVLSIGLLGLANLQVVGLKNNHSAYLRSQATELAYDALDRMRANRQSAIGGDYNVAIGNNASGSSIAAQDVQGWKTELASALPQGDGAIDCSGGDRCTVEVQWNDTNAGARPNDGGVTATSNTTTFSVTTQL